MTLHLAHHAELQVLMDESVREGAVLESTCEELLEWGFRVEYRHGL